MTSIFWAQGAHWSRAAAGAGWPLFPPWPAFPASPAALFSGQPDTPLSPEDPRDSGGKEFLLREQRCIWVSASPQPRASELKLLWKLTSCSSALCDPRCAWKTTCHASQPHTTLTRPLKPESLLILQGPTLEPLSGEKKKTQNPPCIGELSLIWSLAVPSFSTFTAQERMCVR